MAGAQEPHIDKFIIALHFKVEQDPNYKAIQKALIAKKDPKNLPRDYPAQAASGAWANLSLESDMPKLILFMGQIWWLKTAKDMVLKKLHLSNVGEMKTLALAQDLH